MVACGYLEYKLLESWIIEKQKEEERERRIERDRPRVYESEEPNYSPLPKKEEDPKRGVVKIDISPGEEDCI